MPEDPTKPKTPPDPASSYERAKPEKEPGLGKLKTPQATPHDHPDQQDGAASPGEDDEPTRQINAQDEQDASESIDPADPAAHAGRRDAARDEQPEDARQRPRDPQQHRPPPGAPADRDEGGGR